jgi:hypothetical protein
MRDYVDTRAGTIPVSQYLAKIKSGNRPDVSEILCTVVWKINKCDSR